MVSVYLAGPDVFFPDPKAVGSRLERICADAGLRGVFPADPEAMDMIAQAATKMSSEEVAQLIFTLDRQKIDECDAVLANLTPFRGCESDPGTTWEMGYAIGQGKPVWAYSEDQRPYHEKVKEWNGCDLVQRDGSTWDRNNMMVDMLGQNANLMMTRCLVDRTVHADIKTVLPLITAFFGNGLEPGPSA